MKGLGYIRLLKCPPLILTDAPKRPPPKLQEFPSFDGHLKGISAAGLNARMKMAKSKSQGDSIDDNSPLYATAMATSTRTRPAQQDHLYEEVQPKHLTYVDIDLTQNKRFSDRTSK